MSVEVLSLSVLPLGSLNILMTSVLDLVFGRLLAYISFSVLFFNIGLFFLSPHFGCLSLSFYVPSLGRGALCNSRRGRMRRSNSCMGPSDAVSLVT